jgi:hypothetical protein
MELTPEGHPEHCWEEVPSKAALSLFFFPGTGINPGTCICQASALPPEIHRSPFVFILFLRQGLPIFVQACDPPASASRVTGIAGVYHHTQLNAGLKLGQDDGTSCPGQGTPSRGRTLNFSGLQFPYLLSIGHNHIWPSKGLSSY